MSIIYWTASSISLFHHAVDRADALVSATEGAAGAGLWGPAEDVQMHPGPGVLDEALEEQRGGDRAGEGALADVVHIGDLGREHRLVGRPERQAPERVVGSEAGSHQLVGEAIVGAIERRQVGAERGTSGT